VSASPVSAPPVDPSADRELFVDTILSFAHPAKRGSSMPASIALHLLIISALVLVPILWPSELPPTPGIRVMMDLPPPPPPPLSLGNDRAKAQPSQPVTPDNTKKVERPKDEPQFTMPREEPKPIEPEAKLPAMEQQGSPDGDPNGVPTGMIGGVQGGVEGGVLGGQVGGCIGCFGDAVVDYDRDPRIVRQPRPIYPADAAVKRIEGVVVVEIIIDKEGRVVHARVIESIPLLDQAALQNVREWVFVPAMKDGRPVTIKATAEVKFRLL